jgi:DNA-binding NarL/FixJ family response regulator
MIAEQHDCDVWVIEDQRLLRRTLQTLLDEAPETRCGLAADSCEEAIDAIEQGLTPDIVLMDIGLPGMSGIEGTRAIRSLSPTTRVIMLTVHEDNERIFDAICAGASGYLLKPSSTEQIIAAVGEVRQGGAPINAYIASKMLGLFTRLATPRSGSEEYGLTAREREILQHLVDGLTMRQIAERLFVSYYTIDTHIRNIYAKLHVRTRGSAVAKALKERLI